MITRTLHAAVAAAALALAVAPAPAGAATVPAVNVTPGPVTVAATIFTVGYRFQANERVGVRALGAFDLNQDGIVGGADVGLWTLDGTLLATATVPAGTNAGKIVGQFRYVGIDRVVLDAGTQYVLGSFSTDPNSLFNANYGGVTLSTDPRITLLRNRDIALVSALTFPDRESMFNIHLGSFGPNMLIAPVPVPAALPALALALGALTLVGRRRRA